MSKKIVALGKTRKALDDNLYFGQHNMGGIPQPKRGLSNKTEQTLSKGVSPRKENHAIKNTRKEEVKSNKTYQVLQDAFKKKRS